MYVAEAIKLSSLEHPEYFLSVSRSQSSSLRCSLILHERNKAGKLHKIPNPPSQQHRTFTIDHVKWPLGLFV